MTNPFRTLTIAGEAVADPARGIRLSPASLAEELKRRFAHTITVHSIDLSVTNAPTLLASHSRTLVNAAQLADKSAWAPPGADTYIIAAHESNRVDPLGERTPPVPRVDSATSTGAIATLLSLASLDPSLAFASSHDVYSAIEDRYGGWEDIACTPTEPWYANLELLRHVRSLAITSIGNRRLHALTTTSRPLLGLDSTLAVTPDGRADHTMSATTLSAITYFYRQLTLVSEAENLTPGDDGSYARRAGSGGGGGIAALARGLRGISNPLIETLARTIQLDDRIGESDLLVTLTDTLHPQTVHDSPAEYLGERAMALGVTHIAITRECSLSRHEQSEWGLNAVYAANSHNLDQYALRVLCSTWLRQA